jgi:hypothetical protein
MHFKTVLCVSRLIVKQLISDHQVEERKHLSTDLTQTFRSGVSNERNNIRALAFSVEQMA